MSAGLLPLAIATLGAAYAALILRGAQRRDNLVFGLLTLLDAVMNAWRGLNVVTGGSIVDYGVLVPCAIGTIPLALLTLEFVSAFPRRPPMSWRWRAPMLAWGAGSLVLAFVQPPTADLHSRAGLEIVFFLPAAAMTLALCARAWRRTDQRDARIVIATLAFRWIFGIAAYTGGPLLGVFEIAVWVDSVFATTVSCVLIGTAVLRSELFSARSAAAEVVTIAFIALVVVVGTGASIGAVLRHVEPGQLQFLTLFGAALVPLALTGAGFAIYPRVERSVLAGLDDRRARRLGVQGEPLPADAPAAIEEATTRIASIGDGARVRWALAPSLAPDIGAVLEADGACRRAEQPGAPADLVVPALGADRALVGAFLIDGGTIDRDTFLVARELAARVALAVERARAVSELDDARRLAALGQFAAAIAHDIRTPLTSISLNVQILRRKLHLSDDDREHLDIALEELARLDHSVAEILDFAKPVRLATQAIDVGELLEDAAKGLSPVLSERGVALECVRADDLVVHGDRLRLRQVLANLVGNAADASAPGTTVTVRAAPAIDGQVAIEIEDRGRGIDADELPRIFEPFFTTRPDGTGLGLAIVHKVVRAHGGDVRVRSAPGQGSTFTVTLPAA